MKYIKRFNENKDNLDTNEVIDIFKWISDGEYDGKYPNIQLLLESPTSRKIVFQRFHGQPPFTVEDWMINGVKYIMDVYGYKYTNNTVNYGKGPEVMKPVKIGYEIDNPDFDEVAYANFDWEGVNPGGAVPPNTNKKIFKREGFDKIEDLLGKEIDGMNVYISK